MKKIDLGQSIAIFANIGVIAGIVFLGFELQQNNELMEIEARRTRAGAAEEAYRLIVENGDLAAIFVKEQNGEVLTDIELQRMIAYWLRGLTDLELSYRELPESDWGPLIERYRLNVQLFPSLEETWRRRASVFSSDFIDWYDANIAASTE